MDTTNISAQVCNAVHGILSYVTQDHFPLDKAYAKYFHDNNYSSQEHAEITHIAGDIVRKLNLYATLCECSIAGLPTKFEHLLTAWCLVNLQQTDYFLDLSDAESQAIRRQWQKVQDDSALLDGCPEWLERLGTEQLTEQWPIERAALAGPPKRFIRVNSLKTSLPELIDILKLQNINTQPVPEVSLALEVLSNSALFKSQAFKEGLFEQQDAGSQLIAQALDVTPGMRVIDACAGAGGKALALSALMNGKGRLLALDVDHRKLEVLKERAKRASAENIETRWISSSKIIKRQYGSADRVLLDVPCSGIGVLKRNPDAKWNSDLSQALPSLLNLQQDILTRYSKMLKVNGILVYASCSILPIENQQQISKFLQGNPNFKLLEDATISPAATGFDGYFWAKLQRISE